MEEFIKNIIINKRYFELNSKEKVLIKEYAKNEEEFDSLKLTFETVSTFNAKLATDLSPHIKDKLSQRFAAKHLDEKSSFWNKFLLFFFPRERPFYGKPAFQLAAVALIIVIMIPFLWTKSTPQYALNSSNKSLKINKVKFEKENITSKKQTSTPVKEEIVKQKEMDIIEPPAPISIEENVEVHNEELVDVVESEYVIDNFMSTTAVKDVPSFTIEGDFSGTDLAQGDSGVKKINLPKKVETAETLELLTALY